jgi:hypothetical protein
MDKIYKILFQRRRVVGLISVLLFASAAIIFGQTLNRGKLFEIKKFRQVRLGDDDVIYEIDGKDVEKGLELAFRIKTAGVFSDVYYKVTLYDLKKRPIRNGIQNILYDGDARQTTSIRNKTYVSGGTRQLDGFKGRRTYTFTFIPAESYKFAVAEVGNSEEKVYAVYPRTAKLSDFVSGK